MSSLLGDNGFIGIEPEGNRYYCTGANPKKPYQCIIGREPPEDEKFPGYIRFTNSDKLLCTKQCKPPQYAPELSKLNHGENDGENEYDPLQELLNNIGKKGVKRKSRMKQ